MVYQLSQRFIKSPGFQRLSSLDVHDSITLESLHFDKAEESPIDSDFREQTNNITQRFVGFGHRESPHSPRRRRRPVPKRGLTDL